MHTSLHFVSPPPSSSTLRTTTPIKQQIHTTQNAPILCKILVNPSRKTLPRKTQKPLKPPLPLPKPKPSIKPISEKVNPIEPKIPSSHLNPLQKLAASVLDTIESLVIKPLEKKQNLPKTIDPAVQISGNFAPVRECPVRHGLEVLGQIPDCLRGVYVRNGGNPMFTPSGGHHLFDGDGMIHALTLSVGNKPSYSCRYTRTNRLKQEAKLGRSIFPKPIGELHGHTGLARLGLFLARTAVGLVDGSQGTGVANAGLVYFNGRLLAMSEDDLPYNVKIKCDGDLETIGRFDFDGGLDRPMIAHPKLDPVTGELHALSCDVVNKPYLKYYKFDTCGRKSREIGIALEQPTMVHDFAITENYVVIPDHQVVFKLSEMIKGGSPVIYDQKKTSRFGILPKNEAEDGSETKWIDVPNCFCFHLCNAWEETSDSGDKVFVVIGSCIDPPDSVFKENKTKPMRVELSEIRMNMRTGESSRWVIVEGMNLEVGVVNKQLLGQKTRYLYMAITDPWPKCSGIVKVDLETGSVTKYLYGACRFGGEPFYVSRRLNSRRQDQGEGEDEDGDGDGDSDDDDDDEGFIVGFVRDEEEEKSEMVIVCASSMKKVGSVKLPARVPYGFHGTFISEQELKEQASS